MLAALDLFHDERELPVTHVERSRQWRTSQVTPMGGRIIFERLACRKPKDTSYAEGIGNNGEATYVRVNVNDGIVSIPSCSSGPGGSCPLKQFLALVVKRGLEVGDFRETCGLNNSVAERITFLHQ